MYNNLAVLALFVFLYSLFSNRLERSNFGGAVLFTVFGLLVGPLGIGILDLNVDGELLRLLAELTLAIVLFTDSSNAKLKILEKSLYLPRRLLLVGLPLTILLGFFTGVFLFNNLNLLEIAIMATMLAPTDAALGKAVVTDEAVPANIREGLNVESGLNDGICVPVLFAFLAFSAQSGTEHSAILILKLFIAEIGIGALVGIVLTKTGCGLLNRCLSKGLATQTWLQLPVPALAVSCFAVAQWLGGSGFIASFVGGMLFGKLEKQRKDDLLLAAEGTGDTLALITWILFGSAVVGQHIGQLNWHIILYALLSLTVVRMVPVFLALAGTRLYNAEKLFIGWFGPRGMASIVFGVIVLNANLPGSTTIVLTTACTIILSIVAHGISAHPLVRTLNVNMRNRARNGA